MMKTKLEQRDAVQELLSLKNIAQSIETDLHRVRQTQQQIETDLKEIAVIDGPATVHQIGNNYFYKKRKHQMLCAVIQERQNLEQLQQRHMEKLNAVKLSLTQTTKKLNVLSEKKLLCPIRT